ncbi:hypothetical protein NPIL_640831 [Nephila pilipes]|uniref:Uncharacterized protein n=1 Tax=Nephila pilipes TaxID=299642 RepID=A0A8X6QD38_NEPPI|nr:hypothetical protein NPIL_640831 [Nephila pilipes]
MIKNNVNKCIREDVRWNLEFRAQGIGCHLQTFRNAASMEENSWNTEAESLEFLLGNISHIFALSSSYRRMYLLLNCKYPYFHIGHQLKVMKKLKFKEAFSKRSHYPYAVPEILTMKR